MKATIITLLLLAAGGTACLAQCDKKVSFTSSKTQHLDSGGALKETSDEKTTVEFSKTDIAVTIVRDGNDDNKMTGTVKLGTCDWKVPFKEGKTTMSVTLKRGDGESRDFTLTIEGKDGKITLLAENKDQPDDRIKLEADKFEEQN